MKMKYKLYRSLRNLDKDIRKHELAAVEIGADIDAVTDVLIRSVTDELSGMPEYQGCKVYAYAPKPVDGTRRTICHVIALPFLTINCGKKLNRVGLITNVSSHIKLFVRRTQRCKRIGYKFFEFGHVRSSPLRIFDNNSLR